MTILTCDLGGTRLKIGVVNHGVILAEIVQPADSKAGLAHLLPTLKAAWLRMLGDLQSTPRDCAGISLGFPSLVDSKTGRVLSAFGKYADAPDIDLRAWALDEFGLPLAIENDARLALIGEWRQGAGRGSDNLVMLTLGTGLGVSAIIEGKVLRGKHGQAGVLGGHFTVRYPGGRKCSCGNIGCAEAEASTAFLGEMAETRSDFAASMLATEPTLDYAAVFQSASMGDTCALALREHSLLVWGALTVSLIHAYDPERVILGGGIMASGKVILPAIQKYVAEHAHTPWGQVQVTASELGNNAALLAGEWLLQEQYPGLK